MAETLNAFDGHDAMLTLVTGGTGLVGNNVVRMLLGRGRPVRVLARDRSDPRPFDGLDVQIVRGDTRDPCAVAAACGGVSLVIHCAASVHVGGRGIRELRAVNVGGTRNIAAAACVKGVRLVYVSSTDAIGIRSLDEPADEQTQDDPRSTLPYVITKREAEEAVHDEIRRGLDAVIVNPGLMFGPWDWKPSSGRMLLDVAKGFALLAPRGYISVCDVRDVAEGILSAADRGRGGRRYILAGETMSYLQAWKLFADVSGARPPVANLPRFLAAVAGICGDVASAITGQPLDVNSPALAWAAVPKNYSSERARRELDYRHRPVRESVEDAWAWFRRYNYVRGD